MVKRGVPTDTKGNLISIETKVCQKMNILGRREFGPICRYFRSDVGDVTHLRLSCTKALRATLPCRCILVGACKEIIAEQLKCFKRIMYFGVFTLINFF